MDEKVFFYLSYEIMFGDMEDFINVCFEWVNCVDCNDVDVEIVWVCSVIEFWYYLVMVGCVLEDVVDRDYLCFIGMFLCVFIVE